MWGVDAYTPRQAPIHAALNLAVEAQDAWNICNAASDFLRYTEPLLDTGRQRELQTLARSVLSITQLLQSLLVLLVSSQVLTMPASRDALERGEATSPCCACNSAPFPSPNRAPKRALVTDNNHSELFCLPCLTAICWPSTTCKRCHTATQSFHATWYSAPEHWATRATTHSKACQRTWQNGKGQIQPSLYAVPPCFLTAGRPLRQRPGNGCRPDTSGVRCDRQPHLPVQRSLL